MRNNIILPEKQFWIPEFEQRYALEVAVDASNFIRPSRIVSYVFPGYAGRGVGLTKKFSKETQEYYVQIPRCVGSYSKLQMTFSEAFRRVGVTSEYARFVLSLSNSRGNWSKEEQPNKSSLTFKGAVEKERTATKTFWLVSKFISNTCYFGDRPIAYESLTRAEDECRRLAPLNPGSTYVVVQTVKRMTAGQILIQNF